MAQRAARIQDVARAAGVSTATVSRALSNPDLLSDSTRETVFAAIRATGYRVNQAARNLRKQRAGAILVLVPNLGNPFFSQILSGLAEGFAGSAYSVLILDTANLSGAGHGLAEYFLDARIDGMISLDGAISKAALQQLTRHDLSDRFVCACEWVADAPLPSVRSDNVAGAGMAIRYLHGLGHRRIAHVTGPADNVLTQARREGVLAARAELDLPSRPDWIIRGDFSLTSGREAAGRILALTGEDRPSAVFCASDAMAFGLIAALQAAGIRVPQDISVIGFDDIDFAEFYIPALTTIRQDRPSLGRIAAEMLRERLDNAAVSKTPPDAGEVRLVPVELVVRESCGAPA
ncbi:LacI family DNA-binding transcriptional regulator [Paracoccus sp. TK19116]|uniref:LacI family DNA-binding transcriptional regulator n=1 Tax=Paracoccus albicereus TaxID=2922394 RepID=A0ABT1MQ23_9RHOB|nr:LacI family DNA-binding transcriptional regulator [Paracoccus albicereus]MCQ0970224.1 LacI family DNA-binding transcriptional regulator [Paracoccus albicereus]